MATNSVISVPEWLETNDGITFYSKKHSTLLKNTKLKFTSIASKKMYVGSTNNQEIVWQILRLDNLPSNFKTRWRKGNKVNQVVIHGTGGRLNQTTLGLFHWMMEVQARKASYEKAIGLFHYLIPKDGNTIYQIVNPARKVAHSSDEDIQTIGIEMLNTSKERDNSMAYTDNQYRLLNILIKDYLVHYFPRIKTISTHSYRYEYRFKRQRKDHELNGESSPLPECPGINFDWPKFEKLFFGSSNPESADISYSRKSIKSRFRNGISPDKYCNINLSNLSGEGYTVKEKIEYIETIAEKHSVAESEIIEANLFVKVYKNRKGRYYVKGNYLIIPV